MHMIVKRTPGGTFLARGWTTGADLRRSMGGEPSIEDLIEGLDSGSALVATAGWGKVRRCLTDVGQAVYFVKIEQDG